MGLSVVCFKLLQTGLYGHSVLQMWISVIELFTTMQQLKCCKNASQCSIGSHLFHLVEQYIAIRAMRELPERH